MDEKEKRSREKRYMDASPKTMSTDARKKQIKNEEDEVRHWVRGVGVAF